MDGTTSRPRSTVTHCYFRSSSIFWNFECLPVNEPGWPRKLNLCTDMTIERYANAAQGGRTHRYRDRVEVQPWILPANHRNNRPAATGPRFDRTPGIARRAWRYPQARAYVGRLSAD